MLCNVKESAKTNLLDPPDADPHYDLMGSSLAQYYSQ